MSTHYFGYAELFKIISSYVSRSNFERKYNVGLSVTGLKSDTIIVKGRFSHVKLKHRQRVCIDVGEMKVCPATDPNEYSEPVLRILIEQNISIVTTFCRFREHVYFHSPLEYDVVFYDGTITADGKKITRAKAIILYHIGTTKIAKIMVHNQAILSDPNIVRFFEQILVSDPNLHIETAEFGNRDWGDFDQKVHRYNQSTNQIVRK